MQTNFFRKENIFYSKSWMTAIAVVLFLFVLTFLSFLNTANAEEKNVALASNGGVAFAATTSSPPYWWMAGKEALNDGFIPYWDGDTGQWHSIGYYGYENYNAPVWFMIFGVEFPLAEINKVILYQTRNYLNKFNIEYKNSNNKWVVISSEDIPHGTSKATHVNEFVFPTVRAKGLKIVPYNAPHYFARVGELQVYKAPPGFDLVPSISLNTTEDIKTGDKIIIKSSIVNAAEDDITQSFNVKYFIDGIEKTQWAENISSLSGGTILNFSDKEFISLVGKHNIEIIADTTNKIKELYENNNSNNISFEVADCVNEYWYSTVDRNCDGVAGIIEFKDAYNATSFNTNDIKQNLLKGDRESAYNTYQYLKGKTIEWNLKYKLDDSPWTEIIERNGFYTFPSIEPPIEAKNDVISLYFKVKNNSFIILQFGKIIIRSSIMAEVESVSSNDYDYIYSDAVWNKGYLSVIAHTRPDIFSDFQFLIRGVGKEIKTDNWELISNYLGKSGSWQGWMYYYDRANYGNLGRIYDGSYIKISDKGGIVGEVKAEIKEREKINVSDTEASFEDISVEDIGNLELSSERKEHTKREDDTIAVTSFYDADDKIIATSFYNLDGATKVRTIEYDKDEEIKRVIFYDTDGASITDMEVYYPDGKKYKEIIRSGNTENYNRYDTAGRVVYSHSYDIGARKHTVARMFAYGDNGKVAEDITYYADDNYDKKSYSYDVVGNVTEIKHSRRTPSQGSESNYKLTVTALSGGNLSEVKVYTARISAASSAIVTRTESTIYDTNNQIARQRIFDYDNNEQILREFIDGKVDKEYTWDNTTLVYLRKREFIYNESGELEKIYMHNFSYINSLYREESLDIFYYSDSENITGITTSINGSIDSIELKKYYNKDGKLISRSIYTDNYGKKYNANGDLVYMVVNIDEKKIYKYLNADKNVYYELVYDNANSTATSYWVFDGNKVLEKMQKFDGAILQEDFLPKKKIGDIILQSIGIDINNINQSNEKEKIVEVFHKLLPEYRDQISGLGNNEKDKIKAGSYYTDISMKLEYAIYAIEHKVWGEQEKLNEDISLEKTATSWVGEDDKGEFWGFYIMPKKVRMGSVDSVFVDLGSVSAVNEALNAKSYNDFLKFEKRREKFDSFYSGRNDFLDGSTLGKIYYYNLNTNDGAGGYMDIDELTKADPSINLVVDKFMRDMKKSGIDLKTLTERQVLIEFYKYFYNQNLIGYLYDMGDMSQTASETLFRGGGDCEDFGSLAGGILREVFIRIGNKSAANRVGRTLNFVSEAGPISSSNPGNGHATLVFEEVNGNPLYLEASALFLGSGAVKALKDADALTELDSNGSGFSKPAGWYVEVSKYSTVGGITRSFNNKWDGAVSSLASQQSQYGAVLGVNNGGKLAELSAFIKPANTDIDKWGDAILARIPNLTEKAPAYIVKYVHNIFNKVSKYRADSGDIWTPVSDTIAGVINEVGEPTGEVAGDCEDLAFVEASLLQNVLAKYYAYRGNWPVVAETRVIDEIVLLLQSDYNGQKGISHMYVGFVEHATKSENTTIRLIDPQTKEITAPMLYSDLKKNNFFVVITSNNASALDFEDWNNLIISSKVEIGVGGGEQSVPKPDPKEDRVSTKDANNEVKAQAEQNAGRAEEAAKNIERGSDELYNARVMRSFATSDEEKAQIDTEITAQETIMDINFGIFYEAVAKAAEILGFKELSEKGLTKDLLSPYGALVNNRIIKNPDSKMEATRETMDIATATVNSRFGPARTGGETYGTKTTMIGSKTDIIVTNIISGGVNRVIPGAGTAGKTGWEARGTKNGTRAVVPSFTITKDDGTEPTELDFGEFFIGEEIPPTQIPSIPSFNISSPDFDYNPPQYIPSPPAQCSILCSDVSGVMITGKPENSHFAGEQYCSSSPYGSCNDTAYYVTWFCNFGYEKSIDGESCAPIDIQEPVTVTLNASPGSVVSGNSSTLKWSSTGASSCSASGDWSGNKEIGSNKTEVIPNIITESEFVLSCSSLSETQHATATVQIELATFNLLSSNSIQVDTLRSAPYTSTETTITVNPVNGYTEDITLSASISPSIPGITYNFADVTLSSSEYSAGTTFSVTVPNAITGSYIVTVRGDGVDGVIGTVNVPLTTGKISPVFEEF